LCAPLDARTRIIAELYMNPPLWTGPQEEIPAPLPPIPQPRTLFLMPDFGMFEDLYL
jgi:hypothetical protein